MVEKSAPDTIEQYRFVHNLSTRWMDNDVYGHVNNVNYYSFFDTAVGAFLIRHAGLDYENDPCVAWVVDTRCSYFKSIAFPDEVKVGVRVARLGNSSVHYELGIFKNDDPQACAQGHFVHVYVDRTTQRPVPIPQSTRHALSELTV
ncbi:acyl-CoA thioesterase [Orrella marina]|uniref:Thioesterase n=1 Tax=Orrella marina TaxID=2163011 RepID=A0A2R4XL14_9BURK|nr:thioesterase family protein [Orrella marina]AWB34464.1 thioesterase [Orrella marina]